MVRFFVCVMGVMWSVALPMVEHYQMNLMLLLPPV